MTAATPHRVAYDAAYAALNIARAALFVDVFGRLRRLFNIRRRDQPQ